MVVNLTILIFLGLKKQEEDKVKNELRQAQLRQTAIATGSSMGVLTSSVGSSGFTTPLLDTLSGEEYLGHLDIERIRAELSELERGQQQAQQATTSTARSDLDEAHRQSLPVGVMDASPEARELSDEEEDMPPLLNIEEGEEEEDFDDDPELIPADDDETTKAPAQARKHKETIGYSTKITKWQDKSVQENDIRFQLFLRGIELTPEQEEEISKLKVKGKGRNQTRKDYLINYIDRLIQTGKWTNQVNDQLLKKRMVEWREMKKGKGKGSGGASSSQSSRASGEASSALDTAKDIAIGGVKAGVETLAKAGATALAKSYLPV